MRFVVLAVAVLGACGKTEESTAPAGDEVDTTAEVAATPIVPPVVLSLPERLPSTTALTWRFATGVTSGIVMLAVEMPASLDVAGVERWEELHGESFRLEHAPPGLHTIFLRGWRTRLHQQVVNIRENETTDLGTIELQPFPSADMVEGTVRDVNGEPVAGLEIHEVVYESGMFDVVSELGFGTPAFDDGTFLVCPGKSPCWFSTHEPGYPWTHFGARWGERVELVALRHDEEVVPLESRRRAPTTSGNERGSTVLMGMLARPVQRGRLLLATGWVQTLEGASIAFAHDIDGDLFRFEDLTAGTYTLFLRSWRSRWHREPVQLREGQLTDLGAIELELVPSEDFVEGTVRDERGEPIAGVRIEYGPIVESADADATGTRTLTREDGSFLVIPPDAPARLRFRKDGFAAQELEGRADRLLDVVLRRDS